MTTIAYRDGIMAADSLLVKSALRAGSVQKIWQAFDGIAGVSGSIVDAIAFRAWSTSNSPEMACTGSLPRRDSEQSYPHGYYVSNAGIIFGWDGASALVPVEEVPFVATGSGRELALGAMAAGASAEEAVRIAAQFDVYTGGRITTLSLPAESLAQRKPA